jgi:hypothetical protein
MSPLALRLGEGGERGVGDPAMAVLRIENIEMSFGNVDSDAVLFLQGAYVIAERRISGSS